MGSFVYLLVRGLAVTAFVIMTYTATTATAFSIYKDVPQKPVKHRQSYDGALPSKPGNIYDHDKVANVGNEVDPGAFLSSVSLDPLDMCLLGCRMCFQEEDILLSCVNHACLTDVLFGKSLRNSKWAKLCPGLNFLK